MKRFVCSDIIPGCAEVFTGEDDQSVLDQVIAHAAADHGLVKPPLALVELVVATTHPYTAPQKPRHLRLVGGPASADTEKEPIGSSVTVDHRPDIGDGPGREPSQPWRSTVVKLPAARGTQRMDHVPASPIQQMVQPSSLHPQYRHECLLYSSTEPVTPTTVSPPTQT